ncbi:MAG: cytochrome C oxidase subunit IV family protein [Gemmatimonadaceae bacterium]|jgi:cytochrome c oxidase subunit IV
MAHDPHVHADAPAGTPDESHPDFRSMGEVHEHPTWSTYWKVAVVLTLITVVEVWVYYIPTFVASRAFVPALLIMSAVKFAIVVLFYMHLRYDHKLFKAIFTGPLIIAVTTIVVLMFLFGKLAVRTGALN